MAKPASQDKRYFAISIVSHIGILLFLILGFDYTTSLPVFENTNKEGVISAIVLGDTVKSKILTKPSSSIKVSDVLPHPKSKVPELKKPKQDVIALKKPDKKKLAEKKLLEKIKKENVFGKNLLVDIKQQTNKQKLKQKQLESKFKKTLQEKTELSLRQQLLDEEIKMQSLKSLQTQGEVNKYKALILQAISEHWIVPSQANKHLYCKLMIRIAPGGMVLNVEVVKSSGDPSLDSSARAAVLKASPLPVPSDAHAFEAFRQFVLKVKPENILES